MASHDLRIFHIGEADLPRLLVLYDHLIPGDQMPEPSVAAAILQRLRAYQGSDILVGEIGDDLVASCTLIVVPNLTRAGKSYGLIENVVTHQDFRGRGYGRRLLAAASEAAWAAGCYKIMLMTGSQSPATHGFYEAAGFEQSKTGYQKRRIPVRPEARLI